MPNDAATLETLQPGIALLRLTRAARLNALSLPDLQFLHALLDTCLADASLRVLVITGDGEGFCAGLNLKSLLDENGQMPATVRENMD